MTKSEKNTDKPIQPGGFFSMEEHASLYERIEKEIIASSTEIEHQAFAESNLQAESGNYAEAIQPIRPLAFSGNVYAQMLLYEYYSRIEQSKEAILWLQRASKQHHPFADFLLGAIYTANSDELGKKAAEGQVLLVKSAKRGLVDAQYVLGMWGIKAYEKNGDQRQYKMGIRMLRMAAEQDFQPAIDKLEEMDALS